ncbi:hypothetical protein T484DRAFT_1607061, partial [Baffinella frigidus]
PKPQSPIPNPLNPKPSTLNPQTPNPKPQTLNPKPQPSDPALPRGTRDPSWNTRHGGFRTGTCSHHLRSRPDPRVRDPEPL